MRDLRVRRGKTQVFSGLRARHSARADHRPARSVRLRQDDAHALDRRGAEDRERHRHGARRAGGHQPAAASGRLRHPGGLGLRRPHGEPEPPLLRPAHRRAALGRRPRDRAGRALAAMPIRPSHRSAAAKRPASRSRSRCSARPSCSCSTSRRSASTRVLRAELWEHLPRARRRRRDAHRLAATSWTRRSAATGSCSCAAGRIIADTTPDGLLADTGTTDPDAAFLALVERDEAAAESGSTDPRTAAGEPDHPLTRRELARARQPRRTRARDERPRRARRASDERHAHLRDRRPRAAAAEPRPALHRADARRAEPAGRPVRVAVQRAGGRVQHLRRADPRPVPVHRHVPHHVDHDAARAPLGNARAAHDDADRQGRLHRRLRPGVRSHGDAAGDDHRHVRGAGVRTRGRGRGLAARARGRHRRDPRHRARACSPARSRAPSSRPCSSCR